MNTEPLDSILCSDFSHASHGTPASLAGSQRRIHRLIALSLFVFCLHALPVVPLRAQSTTADVVGTVTDATGAVLPGATVQLTNLDTQEKRTATSNEAGQYTFTLLKPNHYSVTISSNGFKTSTIASFNLSAGDRAREDAHLQIGSEQTVVQVEGQAPALHSDTSVLGGIITEKATQDLPLNGRNYINLVQVATS